MAKYNVAIHITGNTYEELADAAAFAVQRLMRGTQSESQKDGAIRIDYQVKEIPEEPYRVTATKPK